MQYWAGLNLVLLHYLYFKEELQNTLSVVRPFLCIASRDGTGQQELNKEAHQPH